MQSISDLIIPSVTLEKLETLMQSKLTDSQSYENLFNFKGTLYLSCYMLINEMTNFKDLLSLLLKDVDIQFANRLEIFDEEAKNNSKMINN